MGVNAGRSDLALWSQSLKLLERAWWALWSIQPSRLCHGFATVSSATLYDSGFALPKTAWLLHRLRPLALRQLLMTIWWNRKTTGSSSATACHSATFALAVKSLQIDHRLRTATTSDSSFPCLGIESNVAQEAFLWKSTWCGRSNSESSQWPRQVCRALHPLLSSLHQIIAAVLRLVLSFCPLPPLSTRSHLLYFSFYFLTQRRSFQLCAIGTRPD